MSSKASGGHDEQEWRAAPPPDHLKPVDTTVVRCVGCGHKHGPVNELINCLTGMLIKEREARKKAEEALMTLRVK